MDTESVARLRGAIGRIARHLNTTSTGEGLTPTQASVLGVVATHGPLGLAELTDLEGVHPTMLSRIVGRLDELGLIERWPDPVDLRAIQVEATAKGTETHRHIRGLRTQALSDCLDRFPKASVANLERALPTLEALADELRARPTEGDGPKSW